MLKKLVGVATGTLMLAGLGAGIASAAKDETKNDHGICTAYFNGQKKGHDRNGSPGPFAQLEADHEDLQAIYDYCSSLPKGIGGQPQNNGRFTECFTDSNDDPSDDCTDG